VITGEHQWLLGDLRRSAKPHQSLNRIELPEGQGSMISDKLQLLALRVKPSVTLELACILVSDRGPPAGVQSPVIN